jgi:ABC-type bacteriocin/lantibiotic exporter with double-glycine peptidase domain
MRATSITLNVPVLDQWTVFPHVPKNDNKACWYTCGFMVLLCRMGLSSVANLNNLQSLIRLFGNQGLRSHEDAAFASELGLEHSPSSVLFKTRAASEYIKALENLGPLIFSEPTHVVVVRGCTAAPHQIIVNDPWGGQVYSYPKEEFEQKIAWEYPIHFRRTKYEPPSVFKEGPNMFPYQSKY